MVFGNDFGDDFWPCELFATTTLYTSKLISKNELRTAVPIPCKFWMWGSLFRYIDFAWQDLLGDVTLGFWGFKTKTVSMTNWANCSTGILRAKPPCRRKPMWPVKNIWYRCCAREVHARSSGVSRAIRVANVVGTEDHVRRKTDKKWDIFLERDFHRISKLLKNPSSRNPVGILNAPTPFGIPSLYHRWVLSCLAKWFQYLCVCLKTRNLQALDGNFTG